MKRGEKELSKSEFKELQHHTRRLSIKEGIFWSFRSSLGNNYVAPFAIFSQMSDSLVAILNSLWTVGPIAQLIGAKKVGKTQRKKVVTKTLFLDSIGWLFMALIALLYLKGIATNILPYLIIADIAMIFLASGYGHPSWFSLIGDLVDSKFRGRWFSKRSTIISFMTILLGISSSFALEYFKEIGKENLAFIGLFFIAFLARIYCVFIMKHHYEPKLIEKRKSKLTLKKFIKEAKKTNLGKFTLFRGMLSIITGMTVPLVSIYLLRHLELDYVSYMMIMLSGTLFSVITLNMWGKIADKYGNYKVIALTTAIIPLTPILWILSPAKIYLFLVPAIIGGTSWSAFIMASGNFIYDNTKKETRGKAISYFNLFTGFGSLIGGIISSLLIKYLNTTWIEPLFLIFIIGSILRFILIGFWIPKIHEAKKKKTFKNIKEFEHLVIKEIKPTLVEDMHEITAIPNYIKEK